MNEQITDAVTQSVIAGALDAADVEIKADPNFVPDVVDVPDTIAYDKNEDADD